MPVNTRHVSNRKRQAVLPGKVRLFLFRGPCPLHLKVMPPVIRLFVNGESREFEKETTVATLLEALGTPSERVAVELNLQILDKQDYARTVLKDGDRLEIISFVGGGRG